MQSRRPDMWIVIPDYDGVGATRNANRCLAAALAENPDYILPFSDDNLMDPEHIKRLSRRVSHFFDYSDAQPDIVYSPPRVIGRDDGWFEHYVNAEFDGDRLMRESYIDVSALCRADLFREIGGWTDERGWPDWDWFKRAHAAGARFERVPHKTWTYRFGHGNVSTGGA